MDMIWSWGVSPFRTISNLYIKKFKWSNTQNATDLKGQTYSVKVDHVFTNGISIEVRKNYEASTDISYH